MKQKNTFFLEGKSLTLSWLHSNDEPRVQEWQQVKDQQSCISVFVAYPMIPSSN